MNTNKLAIYLVVINVFNLLPILPLDGGRLLKNLYFEKNDTITRIFLFLSLGALVYYSIYTASYTLLILPFFLVLQLINHFQSLKLKQQLSACDVHIEQTFEQLSDKDYWKIRDEMGSRIAHFKNIITPGNHEVSEREEVVINYMRNLLRKPLREDLNPFGLLGFTIVWLAFIALPIVLYIIRTSN
jgi:membrane-associated protease RseP (regulator of RpoE activity)